MANSKQNTDTDTKNEDEEKLSTETEIKTDKEKGSWAKRSKASDNLIGNLTKSTSDKGNPLPIEKRVDTEDKKANNDLFKDLSKSSSVTKKSPKSGNNIEAKSDFEDEIKKLKIQLNSSLQENSELFSSLEQVRLESRNLRSKLIALGVDVSALQADETDDDSPEESETRENIRLLNCRLETLAPDLKGMGTRKQLFLHYKGGTGKTCLSIAFGYKLASLGFKVLMIDMDPLSHLTEICGIKNIGTKDSLFDVLIKGKDITQAVSRTKIPNLYVIPSNISLSAIEQPLSTMPLPGERLRMAMGKIENDYDFIIMDSAPNVGFLSLNAVLASDDLIVPMLADYLSYHGLKILFEVLSSIENDFSFTFQNIFVVLNRFNEFQEVCFSVKNALETNYPGFLLKTVIRESVDIANAVSSGKPVLALNNVSRGTEDILKFIFEVLFYIGGKKW